MLFLQTLTTRSKNVELLHGFKRSDLSNQAPQIQKLVLDGIPFDFSSGQAWYFTDNIGVALKYAKQMNSHGGGHLTTVIVCVSIPLSIWER